MVERRPGGGLRPLIMDFGLARESGGDQNLTESGAVMGTVKIIRGARRWSLLFGGEDRRSGGAGMQAMVLNYAQR